MSLVLIPQIVEVNWLNYDDYPLYCLYHSSLPRFQYGGCIFGLDTVRASKSNQHLHLAILIYKIFGFANE